MKATIKPSAINGIITAPASKSIMQRACAAALLHHGKTIILNPGNANDDKAALKIIEELGAQVIYHSKLIEVISEGVKPHNSYIDCGESGLCARLFTPIAAISKMPVEVRGSGSLLQRPMSGFADVLPQLGISLHHFTGKIPFSLQGPLVPAPINVDGSSGSQLLSGVLFALCHTATEPITVSVSNLTSKPYIDLTIDVLKKAGYFVTHDDYKTFFITPATRTIPETITLNVEGDWSSAAYLLVAAAITGKVTIKNLDINSLQADRAIINILQECGAIINSDNNTISVSQNRLNAFDFDATDAPDLFPILAILAGYCRGESSIKGIYRLLHKESNRLESISEMLHQFGISFSVIDDTMYIEGIKRTEMTIIDSYNDHRIAMAAAVGALKAKGEVSIIGADAVNKSYPAFWDDLGLSGASVIREVP